MQTEIPQEGASSHSEWNDDLITAAKPTEVGAPPPYIQKARKEPMPKATHYKEPRRFSFPCKTLIRLCLMAGLAYGGYYVLEYRGIDVEQTIRSYFYIDTGDITFERKADYQQRIGGSYVEDKEELLKRLTFGEIDAAYAIAMTNYQEGSWIKDSEPLSYLMYAQERNHPEATALLEQVFYGPQKYMLQEEIRMDALNKRDELRLKLRGDRVQYLKQTLPEAVSRDAIRTEGVNQMQIYFDADLYKTDVRKNAYTEICKKDADDCTGMIELITDLIVPVDPSTPVGHMGTRYFAKRVDDKIHVLAPYAETAIVISDPEFEEHKL